MQYKQLSIEERELIQRRLWANKSLRDIARELNRNPGSISRELQRNSSPEKHLYNSRLAHGRALNKRHNRGRTDRLKNDTVRTYVIEHLKRRWSPEQIANRINVDIPDTNISHEAIYQYIYYQIHRHGYGHIKPECEDLRVYLRRKRKRRIPKGARRCQRILKPKGTSINDRPIIINERMRIGDWEGDSVESISHKPGINTLVERKTGIVLITKLQNKTSVATINAIDNRFSILPKRIKHSITLDNGPENTDWQSIEEKIKIKCYYANAYHFWERGTNENTNGLIRDYFPKGTDFSMIKLEEIQEVERLLNNRPRKRLNWLTPLEALSVALRS